MDCRVAQFPLDLDGLLWGLAWCQVFSHARFPVLLQPVCPNAFFGFHLYLVDDDGHNKADF